MPNDKNHWTHPRQDGRWGSKREGNQQDSAVFKTQAEAWNYTQQQARLNGGEAYLQGRNGQIRQRNTYGHDPRQTKG